MTESSGILSIVGVELMGWTKVSKGSRSSSRRFRKLASTSQESTMEQFDKTDDLSTSESEKIGASVLERRFSAKAEEIPFKKRNILFSPISPSSSPPSSSPPLQIQEHEMPGTELHIVDLLVSSVEKTDFNDQFIHNTFDTKHNPSEEDFSGIKMLAAVSCNDRSRIDTSFDDVPDVCKLSRTSPMINSGESMTQTDTITDYKKSIKDNEMILDIIKFSKKQSEMDFISPKYFRNDVEFPTICSSSTISGNFTMIDNHQNAFGTSSKQNLSLSVIADKTPHTLEEIKEEDCPCTGVEHEKNVASHNVEMERSPQYSLLSDEHEDSGVTCGSNSDDDCQKFIVDGADTLKLNDSRFNGMSESSNLVPKCVVAKDDSSRIGINLGGGDSELEDGEFRDSFVHHWEGSEAEYGEVEQVDYDSDDKDAFTERKEITPVCSMEDETLDMGSRERPPLKYSKTQQSTEFFIKDRMNLLYDYRKSGTKLSADFDDKNRKILGDMDRTYYSTCLRIRHPHYEQKHYRGSDLSSYIPMDVVRGYSDRRANNSRSPMFKRYIKSMNRSPEPETTPMYRDRLVREGGPFLHEPNRGRPYNVRQHSPYYNHHSKPRRPPSDHDFETSHHSRTRFSEYTRSPESYHYMTTEMSRERGIRQRFRPSVSPDEVFNWTPRRNSSQVPRISPKGLCFIDHEQRIMGERDRPVGRDGQHRAQNMRYRRRFGDGSRGGWERPYRGKRKMYEEQEFMEDFTGRRWQWRR